MKKKKTFLFSPIILLSFSLIAFTALTFLISPISKNIQKSTNSSTSSRPSFPPKSSFRDILPRRTIHNPLPTTLIATGDIMLGRFCNVQMLKNNDWKYPFLKTADLTSSTDITFGNLEAPIVENCPTTGTGMIFCARPESIEGIKFAGFDILSIANNHILNYGQKGLESTKNILSEGRISFSDPNNITMPVLSKALYHPVQGKVEGKQFNNISFGFLSFDLVTYPKTPVIEKVKENISKTDVLIVSLHWGAEYQKEPEKWQKDLAHQIIDSGVKVIIGHHPHVTQPMETYHNGLIFYSLGNFVFDQPWSEETKKGGIAKIIFEGINIKSSELIPIYIQDFCQPVVRN